RIALLETVLGHSKVAKFLTIGHPAGAPSPAARLNYKGRLSMTSKLLLAAASAGLLFWAVHTAAAADAQPPQITHAVAPPPQDPKCDRARAAGCPKGRQCQGLPHSPGGDRQGQGGVRSHPL